MEEKRKIVSDILGGYNRRGNEHLYHCPYCKHHKKKMSINFAQGVFKCWVCDTRGKNIYRIVRKFGNYNQRQKWLELEGRLDLTEFDKLFNELNEIEIEQVIDLPKEMISLCRRIVSEQVYDEQRLPLLLEQTRKIGFGEDFNAQFFCLLEFAACTLAGNKKIRLFGYAGRRTATVLRN